MQSMRYPIKSLGLPFWRCSCGRGREEAGSQTGHRGSRKDEPARPVSQPAGEEPQGEPEEQVTSRQVRCEWEWEWEREMILAEGEASAEGLLPAPHKISFYNWRSRCVGMRPEVDKGSPWGGQGQPLSPCHQPTCSHLILKSGRNNKPQSGF